MNDLLREFLIEADELIEALFADIEELSLQHGDGRARRRLVGRIFRHVHTIKGTASAAELETASVIAHEFETLLDALRIGRTQVSTEVLNVFEDSTHALEESLRAAAEGRSSEAPQKLLQRLRDAATSSQATFISPEKGLARIAGLPPEIESTLSQYERQRLREATLEGLRLYLVIADFDFESFDESFRQLSVMLSEQGEVVSTLPGLEAASPDKINFRILHASSEHIDSLSEQLARLGSISISELDAGEREVASESGLSTENGADSIAVDGEESTAVKMAALVRVDLADLDAMITATHELLMDTISALDLALSTDLLRADRTEIEIRATRIKRQFVSLEERLVGLRLIPLSNTLTRAARSANVAARALGKAVEIEISGADVRLDKSLADRISDPLLHILRNAVSHGIEPAEERLAKNKSERGKIRIEAVGEGSRVRIRVTDDGGGIDPARVTRVAVEQGLIEEGTPLTRQQSLRLIFRPGFSTAQSLSSVSGRGVGLDVVERAVEQAGGELRIWSEPQSGTGFEMVLPTTLALIPSLLVHSNDHRYTIDASHVAEAGYVSPSQIDSSGDGEFITWRGVKMPLVQLRHLLGQPERDAPPPLRYHVVISHLSGQQTTGASDGSADLHGNVAVVVDGWTGHDEVLVRSLGRHASRWRGISGAAELRDGSIALVLDLPRLLEMHS
jgi:two-component system chemotaxis sensor kinase CheA